ncbi:MAG TPA: acetolactate synthase small subunit [Syntrophaceae bacterium]|jgi:acetolactate synthase-1/3 small subunit|nr:acetolactate synthase small subunit [Syntrophaceae bacterium]
MEVKENTISILVNNRPDVLARIAGTFSGRGFNIESISANITRNPDITRIIITTLGNRETVIKLEKQLTKIIDVLEVKDLTRADSACREMILVRMKWTEENHGKIMQTIDTLKWKIVSMDADICILEITGGKEEISNALAILDKLGMDDFTRTGVIALECHP